MNPETFFLLALKILLVWGFGGCFLLVAAYPVAEKIGYRFLLPLSGPIVWLALIVGWAYAGHAGDASRSPNAPRL